MYALGSKRKIEDTQGYRREGNMKTEAEIGVMYPQIKEDQRLLVSIEARREA